jgi:hypothetical protein
MQSYPYVLSKKRLVEFLQKIPKLGVPSKVDKQWLTSAGYSTENDMRFVSVLKSLDFIDAAGNPTDNYKNFRGTKAKSVLANAIKSGYSALFAMHPDANTLNETDLNDFFSGSSSSGSITVIRMVNTFQGLCENADFNGNSTSVEGIENITDAASANAGTHIGLSSPADSRSGNGSSSKATPTINTCSPSPIININIELSLPDTKDSEVYDNFFAAMRKHLFP